MKHFKNPAVITFFAVLIMMASLAVYDSSRITVCDKEVTIVEITSVNYRTAYALADDGKIYSFRQPRPTLKAGSKRCLKSHMETKK